MTLNLLALYSAASYWAFHSGFSVWKAVRVRRLYASHRKWADTAKASGTNKKVALVIATKGISKTYDRFLDFILTQDYRNYRVIFVTESSTDPAHGAIVKKLQNHEGKPEVELLVAGLSDKTGQKVHNLRAALATLRNDDEIVAFADADIYGHKDWLSCLVLPLNKAQADFTTGYRWFLPESHTLPNQIIGAHGIAMESWISSGWRMILWGGTMAVSRSVYEELEIHKNLAGCLSDDVRITELAHKAGKTMRYVRSAEASTPVDFTFPSLFEFGRRQYMCLGLHRRRMLYCAFLFPLLYLASFALCTALLVSGCLWMLATVFLVILFNIARQRVWGKYVSERFSGDERSKLLASISNSWWIVPIEKTVNLIMAVCALFAKEMVWGGIRYRINGPRSIEIIERGT